jgi:endonuclease/exonuclease/phosphatase family metal-dependent hydrolase
MRAGNDACRPPALGSRRCGQTSSRYKRADAGHTFSPSNPLVRAGEMPLELGRRIDYIMIRSGIHGPTLAIADCRRVLDRRVAGIWASDHFGVVADLQVPTHPPGTWQDIEFH